MHNLSQTKPILPIPPKVFLAILSKNLANVSRLAIFCSQLVYLLFINQIQNFSKHFASICRKNRRKKQWAVAPGALFNLIAWTPPWKLLLKRAYLRGRPWDLKALPQSFWQSPPFVSQTMRWTCRPVHRRSPNGQDSSAASDAVGRSGSSWGSDLRRNWVIL